jgi:DNA-directed RNA polymerase subunit RPC12/RpoP
MFCVKCGTQVPDGGVFCCKCGSPVNDQLPEPATSHNEVKQIQAPGEISETTKTEAKSVKVQGGIFGLISGAVFGIGCLVPVGIVLCITGIGAIIGIPIVIVGLIFPIIQFLNGMATIKGNCPWCQTSVTCTSADRQQGGVTCPACKKRIVIKDKTLIKIG